MKKNQKTKKLKILLFDFNNILSDVELELRKRGHTILAHDGKDKTTQRADVVVLWNETENGDWSDWVRKLNKMKKRTVLVQHGRRGTSRIYPPFNEPLKSDVLCAWGENDLKRLVEVGVPKEKIRLTGTPIFKRLIPRQPHVGVNVVFSPEHWDIDVAENQIVVGWLEKLKGVHIISKVLNGEHWKGVYPNPVWSDRRASGHLDICAEVLSQADVLVGISESTFELLGQYLDIPVIIADIWTPKACGGDERYKQYNRIYSNACVRVKNEKDMERAIQYALKHPEHLREERKEIVRLDGGIDLDNPTEKICDIVEHG